MPVTAISFKNDLAYDVIVYDSSNPDHPTDAENNYLGELVSLGTVKANTASDLMPLQPGSAFVIESATAYKPVKRCTLSALSKIKSFNIEQADEDAMTASFKFIDFTLKNKEDAITKAFNAVIQGNQDNLLPAMNAFFALYPDYSVCTFQTYMMGLAYVALTPESVGKPPAEATYSLSRLVSALGGVWPGGMPDIAVSHFTCSYANSALELGMHVEFSALPFESDDIKENAKSLLSGYTLKATLQVSFALGLGIFGTRLTINFDQFNIPLGGSNALKVTKPAITLDINPLFKFVVLTLTGSIPFDIYNKPFDANISLTIDNEEAHIGTTITGDNVSFPTPPGLKGLFFDEFGVGMGLFFKPPAFALGIDTKFHVGKPKSGNVIDVNDDSFVLVCKTEGDLPAPVYASFYIPKMDINEVVEIFTNASPNISVPVNFSDLSFRWSANPMDAVALPDGSLSEAGYCFRANVNIFAFQFHGDVELDMSNGLTADVEMSPLNWNDVFKMTGDGKGVTIKVDENGNPIKNNQIRDSKVLQDELAKATDKQIVSAGGPVLVINTLKLPVLHLNAKLSLFELIDYSIQADINKDGVKFVLDYGAILMEQLSCTLADFHNLYASFKYYLDQTIVIPPIDGVHFGSFPISAYVETHLTLNTSLSNIKLNVGGSIDFQGMNRSFGDFTADVHIKKITDLLKVIGDYIEQEAKQIFGDFLNDASGWAAKAASGFISIYDPVATVLKNGYHKTAEEMTSIMKAAGYGYQEVANGLKDAWNADSIAVASIMRSAGYTANEVANGIKNAWNCGVNDVTYAMHAVGYGADELAGSLRNAFNAGAQEVTNSFKWVGYSANEVGIALKDVFNAASNDVASVMKAAGYTADEVAGSIKNAWNCSETDVAYAMKLAGYTADEVGNSLKDTFNAGANDVAGAMKAVGYSAEEVASTLKNTFNMSAKDIASAMNSVGYAADQVADAFKTLGGDFADFASKTWDKITDKNTWNPSKW